MLENIRLGQKCLTEENALAYYPKAEVIGPDIYIIGPRAAVPKFTQFVTYKWSKYVKVFVPGRPSNQV